MIGLVLSESPRRVTYSRAAEIIDAVTGKIAIVGVFGAAADLLRFNDECDLSLDFYQVYFDCSLEAHNYAASAGAPGSGNVNGRCRTLRQPTKGWIRSYFVDDNTRRNGFNSQTLTLYDFKNQCRKRIEELLNLDTNRTNTNVIIAGHLSADNVEHLIKSYHPYGVDCARGTESSPGIKDIGVLQGFVGKAKHALD
jgi:phosphoribosylanthranilate isomerase